MFISFYNTHIDVNKNPVEPCSEAVASLLQQTFCANLRFTTLPPGCGPLLIAPWANSALNRSQDRTRTDPSQKRYRLTMVPECWQLTG